MSKALATKNVAAVLLGVAMVFGFAFSFANPAKADTLSDLQAQVQALLAQIAALQGGSTTTTGGACFTFTQNLKVGATSAEVMQVQKFLNSKGFTVAATGAGSPGNETSYFGPATKAAVIKFQNAYAADILTPNGLTAGNGNWYASTRAKANALCTSTGGNTGGNNGGTTTGGNVMIAAASQPANSLAPEGASRVPFTTFTLTNTSNAAVTINGVTVQRTGLGNNAVFSGIVLVDSNNVQIGNSKTLNSNNQATVGDNFTLAAGQSMTLTVAGNMASTLDSYQGQVVSLSVVGVNTSATVGGSLPITGASQTINGTLSIGSVSTTTSSYDPGSAQNKNIGDASVRFSGVRFTANSSEDVKLYSLRWRQTGTASAADISNIVTVVNGTSYPTTLSADGKYYVSVFPGGILIGKGNSIDVYVQGDITGSNATSRNVEFDLDKASDAYFVGQTYGYGIPASNTTGQLFHGYLTTIQGGSATSIQNATSISSQNIPVNVSNTVLGGFQTNFVGEPVSVSGITLSIATTTAGLNGLITGVSIVDENGAVVAGPQDATWDSSSKQLVTLSDTITFPLGVHTYTIKGKIPSNASNGATVQVSTTPSSWTNPTGQTSGNTVSLSANGQVNMSTQTVKGATLTVTASPNPVAQTIVSGGTAVTLGNVVLDATQSGEDIRLNSIPLKILLNTTNSSNFNTCQLYNGATALNGGSNVLTPSSSNTETSDGTTYATINFDNSLVIAKGTSVTLAFKCNIVSNSTGSVKVGVKGAVTAYGVQSGTSVSNVTVNDTFSGLQTYTTGGTFTASVDSATTPSRAFAAAGTTQVTAGVIKLRSSNEDVTLQKLGLKLTNSSCGTASTGAGASSNGCVNDLVNVVIYDGNTPVGSATFVNDGSQTATSSLSTPVVLTKDTDKLLTVKVDLAQIGTSASGGIGDLIKVDPAAAQGIGNSSGSTVWATASGNTNGVQLVKTFPTVANGNATNCSNNNACSGSNQTLKRFTITANSAGSVGINKLSLAIATSTAQVTSATLYAYTDAGYSQPVSTQGSGTGAVGSPCTPTSSTPTCAFTASTNIQIPSGTTYYFALLGTVVPSGSTYSVNATLNGDSSMTVLSTYNAATTSSARLSSANMIWSDNATTTAGANDVDWFNGFQVPGLPSTGI
ncbi:MAG TPA: peptidoglycan-binding domain-containing protein [Candidatus Paceibacterota bacterium]|nr:peptidoglycan-binding domain-containing protein [Candidatus Paceibacterota bacterium]